MSLRSLEPYGLAETCRVVRGGIPLWTYHRTRLQRGGCPASLLRDIERQALLAAAKWSESLSRRVRLGITVHPGGDIDVDSGIHLSSLDVVNGPVARPVRLEEIASVAASADPPLPPGAAKPADRSWWDAAQGIAKAAAGHQAVILDADGLVVDGGTATVWIAEGARLATPPAPPAVGGVARAFVLAAVANGALGDAAVATAGAGAAAAVEHISWERLEAADEVFLTNAFAGAVAVRGRGGPMFAEVRALFARLGVSDADVEPLPC